MNLVGASNLARFILNPVASRPSVVLNVCPVWHALLAPPPPAQKFTVSLHFQPQVEHLLYGLLEAVEVVVDESWGKRRRKEVLLYSQKKNVTLQHITDLSQTPYLTYMETFSLFTESGVLVQVQHTGRNFIRLAKLSSPFTSFVWSSRRGPRTRTWCTVALEAAGRHTRYWCSFWSFCSGTHYPISQAQREYQKNKHKLSSTFNVFRWVPDRQ